MSNAIQNWSKYINDLSVLGENQLSQERRTINLIASDNAYSEEIVQGAMYSGDIIQEGLVGERPFAGAKWHDEAETAAAAAACQIFGFDHANVQPHSCSQANQAVYHALLQAGDPVLALDFRAGGHLTHGLKMNFSGRMFNFSFFGLGEDGLIDYGLAIKLAKEKRPKLIVCGSSSYPRLYETALLRQIADDVGAYLMLDLSHEAGLIAGGAMSLDAELADVVTMSLDKTLRGPFGAIILCRSELARKIDRAVHPGTQSSFPVRRIFCAALSLAKSQMPDFREYARAVLENATALADVFPTDALVSGGTDKHYIILRVNALFGLSGAEAERKLEDVGLFSSRQSLSDDPTAKMSDAGGLRLGTPWITSRGYRSAEAKRLGHLISDVLGSRLPPPEAKAVVEKMASTRRERDIWKPE